MKIEKQILIGFLIVYLLWIICMTNGIMMSWDGSANAIQSHIYYDFIKGCVSGNGCSWSNFAAEYSKIIPSHFGFFTSIDPPGYSIVQAFLFLLFGSSYFIAMYTTVAITVLLAPLLYLLSKKILNSSTWAILVVVLYLLSAIAIDLVPMVIVDIPVSLIMVGWFYFTFYRDRKDSYFLLGGNKYLFNRNWVYGALFLTWAGLIRYQNMIFYAVFMSAYFIYLLIKKQNWKELIFIGVIQSGIFLVLAGPWLWYMFSSGIWERVLFEGAGRGREWSISQMIFYFKEIFPKTCYLAVLAFIPLIKDKQWSKSNARLIIMVLSLLITATFLISNQQLRYVIFVVPLIYIFIVKGISLFKWKPVLIFLVISLSIISGVIDIHEKREIYGTQDYEVLNRLASVPEPKAMFYIHPPKNLSSGLYANPDNWLFGLQTNGLSEYQMAQYIYWSSIEPDPAAFFDYLTPISEQAHLSITIPKYRAMNAQVDALLLERNYTRIELEWYYVYEK